MPPVLGGLCAYEDRSLLCGGRTPALVKAVKTAAESNGCNAVSKDEFNLPTRLEVHGSLNQIDACANDSNIAYTASLADYAAKSIVPIATHLQQAPRADAPINWVRKVFDFDSLSWIDGTGRNSAYEFASRYGKRRFFVSRRRGRLLELPKREAVYAASMIQGVSLAAYDGANEMLSTPLAAPFPELISRTACLCTGTPASIVEDRIVYSGVPQRIAAVLLVAAGQPFPKRSRATPILGNTYG